MKKLALTGIALLALMLVFNSCAGQSRPQEPPSQALAVGPDELDFAIRDVSDYLNDNIPSGNRIVILNIESASVVLSDYIIDELIANAVNDRIFEVIDRQRLDLIREEQNFQMSGEVNDELALSVGRFFGAQTIVSGRVMQIGDRFRITIRALDVETARIQGQYNRNLAAGPTINALMAAGGARPQAAHGQIRPSVPGQTQPPILTASQETPVQTVPIDHTAAAPDDLSRPGLYIGNSFYRNMNLIDAVDWIKLNAVSDGNYTIVLGRDEVVSPISLSFNNMRVNVSLKTTGTARRVRYQINNPQSSLFTVGEGVTFTMYEGVNLIGLNELRMGVTGQPLVTVVGGTFIMNGGSIRDNRVTGDPNRRDNIIASGAGVRVKSGEFIMNDGTISGNTSSSGDFSRGAGGGGVFIFEGTFTMNDGAIRGNSAIGWSSAGGGGVYIYQGTFTMNNGTISGNSAGSLSSQDGGGVRIESGIFSMNNGTISGNSATRRGGGVYAGRDATFIKSGSGGIIYGSNADERDRNSARQGGNAVAKFEFINAHNTRYHVRNTTARITQALDSRRSGPAGGWE